MKYIYQLFIILVVTFVGELLHYFIPIPVPASIYGLIIMLILLCTKVVKLEHVERTSDFLIEIMPLMFIPGGVGLVTALGRFERYDFAGCRYNNHIDNRGYGGYGQSD